MSTARESSIFGVLLALDNDHLLLPNVAVLEVGNVLEVSPGPDAAPWFCGSRPFEGRAVPVVDFEALNTGTRGEPRRARAIYLQTLGERLQSPVIALLCRGHPHLVDIERDALHAAPLGDNDRDDLVLGRALLGSTRVAIPDILGIETELALAGVASR